MKFNHLLYCKKVFHLLSVMIDKNSKRQISLFVPRFITSSNHVSPSVQIWPLPLQSFSCSDILQKYAYFPRLLFTNGYSGRRFPVGINCELRKGPFTPPRCAAGCCTGLEGSPYWIAERRVSELIPVFGSQPAGDVSHKPGGRLPLLSAITLAALNRAATSFAACWTQAKRVWTVCLRLLPDSVAAAIWTQALLRLSLAH